MKKIVITGSSGRIGRALYWQLSQEYRVKGVDISASSSTNIINDIRDYESLPRIFEGADTIFHSAALHAPHVDLFSEKEFYDINVNATEKICKAAIECGVSHIVFTSTTALYGYANQEKDKAAWVNEQTIPKPKTIYHKTKLEAENVLKNYSSENLSINVIRMSRCFPEPAQTMAVYRLHRGVDYRDVAKAHILASQLRKKKDFDIYIVSGTTPFLKSDCVQLLEDPETIIRERYPQIAREFDLRGWKFPGSIDRVYDSTYCQKTLGWQPEKGPLDVFKQFDDKDFEVLPPS
ncbi:NAD-dependent epimerase/dehydratase family protein [Roseivirga sp.]|uniref:NAD-dependent epimerase/dehydratase family protein n=1 Tax=Roseivirga sp. TaxID=1964215 RepID=UPI003B5253E1